jgi:hypothetical protein
MYSIGGNGFDQAEAVAIDSLGNGYLVGRFDSTTALLSAGSSITYPSKVGIQDVVVIKLNSAGVPQWAKG